MADRYPGIERPDFPGRFQDAREAIGKLEGIDCRGQGTSCPDQLARALRTALNAGQV